MCKSTFKKGRLIKIQSIFIVQVQSQEILLFASIDAWSMSRYLVVQVHSKLMYKSSGS